MFDRRRGFDPCTLILLAVILFCCCGSGFNFCGTSD